MSSPPYEEHARSAAESKFHDTVISVKDHSRTNSVFIIDLNRSSKKKVKYRTFKWHPKTRFLGGAFAQKYLGKLTEVVPEVYGIYQKDPLELVNTSWFITDYSEGDVTDVFHAEDYTQDTATEIATALGETLAAMHNQTFTTEVDIPVGQIEWNKESNTFKSNSESWEEEIMSITQARYTSFNGAQSPLNKETVSALFNFLADEIERTVPNSITPVISNLDYRPGNAAFDNLHSTNEPAEITGIFDWDRAMYGDWQHGLAIGEFFLINTTQHDQNRKQIQENYRTAYLEKLNHDVTINEDAYKTYIGTQYLQQCRSFQYWYKDRTEEWLEAQRVLTENHINKLLNDELVTF